MAVNHFLRMKSLGVSLSYIDSDQNNKTYLSYPILIHNTIIIIIRKRGELEDICGDCNCCDSDNSVVYTVC